MRTLILLLLLASGARAETIRGRVTSVHDGDTLRIGKHTIRLEGIDAPELRQPFGIAARNELRELVDHQGPNATVRVKGRDRYGRIVGRVYLGYDPPTDASATLLLRGMAHHYRAYSRDPELARIEAQAKRYRRGLWSQPAPIAPWVHRQRLRAGHGA